MAEAREPDYEPVIGLEIHVQLGTRTKMFCGCALSFGEEPNTLTCPVCLGHPGSLPTLNAEAIHFGLMMAAAFGCEVPERSVFSRKNYFYPDLPKGYQISQYDQPLATGGELAGVRIHRVHLEEDAAKLIHAGGSGRIHGAGTSLVDFNRGGTPLAEIVTEPDLRSAEQAGHWLRRLRVTLEQLGVSDVNMEEGSLRCDANVSLRPAGSQELGVKTELKNMNSFRFLERGVRAELARQEELLRAGEPVLQETFHYDPVTDGLTPLRSKEEAHDYRYFPEPDLVPVAPTAAMRERARGALPELPLARVERLEREIGLATDQAETLAFTRPLGDFYERAVASAAATPKRIAEWVTGELIARLREDGLEGVEEAKVTPEALGHLVAMVEEGAVSQGSAKEVLAELVRGGGDPGAIVEARGLAQISDEGELEEVVRRAIEANADAAEQVRGGNQKAIGAIMGAVMRETQGRADGGRVNALIRAQLGL